MPARTFDITEPELRDLYITKRLPKCDIAAHYGCSVANINRCLKKFGLKRGKRGQKAWNKGLTKDDHPSVKRLSESRMGEGNPMHGVEPWNAGLTKETDERVAGVSEKLTGRELSAGHREKLAEAKRGKYLGESNRWSGDRIKQRYRYLKRDGKSPLHHRMIAEELLGRPLLHTEQVHHIDRNGVNNCPSNLLVLSDADHTRLHGHVKSKAWVDQRVWLDTNGIHYIHLGSIAA